MYRACRRENTFAIESAAPDRIADPRAGGAKGKADGSRLVWNAADGVFDKVPTYGRSAMTPGVRLKGPCMIFEAGTSTFVSAQFDVRCDSGGALVLERRG